MKKTYVTNSRLAKLLHVNAIVLYPFVFFATKAPDPVLVNHEEIHLAQIRKNGVLKFYGIYLIEYALGRLKKKKHFEAYRGISFEKEAYAFESDLNYLINETQTLS